MNEPNLYYLPTWGENLFSEQTLPELSVYCAWGTTRQFGTVYL